MTECAQSISRRAWIVGVLCAGAVCFAGLALLHAQPADKEKLTPKLDAAAIEKLVGRLKSTDFKTRQHAETELLKLDEVPAALRDAIKSSDLETRRRAQAVIDAITARVEEKAFQAMIADLQKIEVDRFIRRMITDEKFRGDKEWKVVETLAKTAAKRANDIAGVNYPVPDIDMKSLPVADLNVERVGIHGKRVLLNNPTDSWTSISNSVVLCTGTMPRVTEFTNSIIICDGDLLGATGMDDCLLIVSGKVGRFTGVRGSVILVKGEFGVRSGDVPNELRGATTCDASFLQAKNDKIIFTASRDCVLIRMTPLAGPTNNRIIDTDKGPLQMLKFFEPKK